MANKNHRHPAAPVVIFQQMRSCENACTWKWTAVDTKEKDRETNAAAVACGLLPMRCDGYLGCECKPGLATSGIDAPFPWHPWAMV